jgi:hypothetical protein
VAPLPSAPHFQSVAPIRTAPHIHVGMDVWRRSHGRRTMRCGADGKSATQKG